MAGAKTQISALSLTGSSAKKAVWATRNLQGGSSVCRITQDSLRKDGEESRHDVMEIRQRASRQEMTFDTGDSLLICSRDCGNASPIFEVLKMNVSQ